MANTIKRLDSYEKIKELGSGGNANVYFVRSKENQGEFALKQLYQTSKERRVRFVDEINIIKDNFKEIEGIIPIIDHSIAEHWYTMPIAMPAIDYIRKEKLNIFELVKHMIKLCETLEYLHKKGISHRDIKPANVYYYNERFYLGDFGLVEFSENPNNFTRSDRGLGAIFTISPEMKRNPKEADGKKADVFSLAKTMWMFLTEDETGFDGVYSYLDSNHGLRFIDKYTNEHTVEIDELLKEATDNNPDNRPTIKGFKEKLLGWIDIYVDMDKSQVSDWSFLNKQIFGSNAPDSSSWSNSKKIIEILNVIGKTSAYNHMFFSKGGGLDFSFAKVAAEENCIKLYDTMGFCHIAKPKKLYYEGFEGDFKWNYFLLEFDNLESIFKDNNDQDEEYLVEDIPGHYVSANYAQYGVYDYDIGNPLPDGSEVVRRFTRGKILIVMKNGPYNRISETYDGRHGDCTAIEFRDYMDGLIKIYSDNILEYGKSSVSLKSNDKELEEIILSFPEFRKNPFKDSYHQEEASFVCENQQQISQRKNKDYIKNNFSSWDFSNIVSAYKLTNEGSIKFSFEFKTNYDLGISFKNLFERKTYVLCEDGYVRKEDASIKINALYLFDREEAIKFRDKLENKVSEILFENGIEGFEEIEHYFSIKATRCGKPSHLFTKNEIMTAMKNADDRKHNLLIINENGEAQVLTDIRNGNLFPVRHEIWNAGNLYVGKYSTLSTLEDDYISSLQGWLLYLETGRNQYMDYVHENTDEEDLLEKIKKYY